MATPDVDPWIYDFRYNYYENFYRNRLSQMSTSGSFYDMFVQNWAPHDEVLSLGGVNVNNGIDIKAYVQKHYNGDMPECIAEKFASDVDDIIDSDWFKYGDPIVVVTILIARAVHKFFKKIFGISFICSSTLGVLGNDKGTKLLSKLKRYRDTEVLSTKEGIEMVRYYEVIGPRIVEAISKDKDAEIVYKYLYAEYISELSGLIDVDRATKIYDIYFRMLDDMVKRYEIKTSKRFEKWVQNSI